MKQSVQVTIFGQKYTVRSEASPHEVQRVADFVNGRIEELSRSFGSPDSLNTAILALLNVSGSYLKLLDEPASPPDADDRIRRLCEKIEREFPAQEK